MTDLPTRDRRFSDEEVALIIKRAAELQQTERIAQEPSTSLTLADIEQIAKEAGIEPALVRRAAHTLDQRPEVMRPSPWTGAPTRIVVERVIDAEIPVEAYETLVNEVRRTLGDNGVASVLGRTLAWTSTSAVGRRNARGRQIDVSIISRAGVTTVRVEEELRNTAGALFGGLVGGGGGGTTGITIGIGMGVLHSAPLAALLWVAVAGGFYALARTIFGNVFAKRERQLTALTSRLETEVMELSKERS